MSLLSANLKAFLAVARKGTVHGAALQLRITQTGVTQRVRSLEKELETALFLRSRKGMALTHEGEALLRYCEEAEVLEGEALSQIHKSGTERPVYVTVVGPTSVMTARIVPQCAGLYAQWPKLQLNFIVSDTNDRLALVRSGQASLAITPVLYVPNEMDSKKIKPERFVLVATVHWRRRRLAEILKNERVIDFHQEDLTTIDYLKKFGLQEQIARPRLFVNNNEALLKLFCRGVGFGTLTYEVAKPYLDSDQLILLNDGASNEVPLALIWYPRANMPAYFQAVIDEIH